MKGYQYVTLQPLIWPEYLNWPTTVVRLASEQKSVYLKWSLLTANVAWVLSPTRGMLLLFILESAQQRSIPSTAGNGCSASVCFWDFPFLMLPWLNTSSVHSLFPGRFSQFHLHVVDWRFKQCCLWSDSLISFVLDINTQLMDSIFDFLMQMANHSSFISIWWIGDFHIRSNLE